MALAVVILAAALGGAIFVTDEEMTDESDAAVPLIPLLIWFIGGMAAGMTIYDLLDKTTGQDEADAYTRQIEAGKIAESIQITMADYHNSLNNYINIWRFTNEHFIRTAEIMTATVWSEDADYHPSDVLVPAGVYENSSYMMSNASVQISNYFQNMNKRLTAWNEDPVYADMMTLEWRYGNQSISTKSDFGGWLKSTATVTSESSDKVYISGGTMYVYGGSATITSGSTSITLANGVNNLDALSSFTPGVYELQTGRQYAGDMIYVIDSEAANITPGIVMQAGTTLKLATLYGDKVVVDGYQYNTLEIGIVPDGGTRKTATVHDSSKTTESALSKFQGMHTAVNNTIVAANSAASTVWNIYDKAGESSIYLTTLMVPNYYDNISITQSQQELVTTLAMIQLADYVKNNQDEISAGDYALSGGSFTLFLRGDLVDANGNTLYKDVIYTPFYFINDQTITTGSNTYSQPSVVAVWTESNGQTLSSWNFTSNTQVATLVAMTSGETMYVYEILYNDNFVTSVDLDVKQIEIIDPEDYPIYIPERFEVGDKDWVELVAFILIILGVLAALSFPLHKRVSLLLGGVLIAVIGALLYLWRNSLLGGLL